MKIIFLILKITGKKWTGEMVENGTGVKNWCQFRFVNKIAKIIFPFIALNFKYFSKVGIKFDKLTIDTTEISLFKNNIPNLC